jgi:hypothetical protein
MRVPRSLAGWRLTAKSHFPMLEIPDEMASAIEQFVG